MTKFALALFLLLYGTFIIFHPSIPEWVLGIIAIIAGLLCLMDGVRKVP